jgi:hypothetical protein
MLRLHSMKIIVLLYISKKMKKLFKKVDWWFDYYFAWMFYNGMKQDRYVDYMRTKWPEKIKDFENS